jgi:HK97 family phage portal protein
MIQSRGVLVKSPDRVLWQGSLSNWPAWLSLNGYWSSYSAIYRSQLWPGVLINKIANAAARLPLKVYRADDKNGRVPAFDTPYGQLLARPSSVLDPMSFWLWTVSTLNIHGEAFWGKRRDAAGRPVELVPLHPCYVRSELDDEKVKWRYESPTVRYDIERRDLVQFKLFNPDSFVRGMSPLEPLRATLENEDGARRANSALWRNGGRPSVTLQHPGTLSEPAMTRLSAQWKDIHGGVDNWGKALILEEAMTANVVALNIEELQYIEARKLNREEVCAAYDVPPPVVHILDKATFSNITEQMRSMYRDTMAPKLGLLESTLEFELRDGRFDRTDVEPDFGADVYAEFLMDGVLRGSFETRTAAYQAAIQSGWMTPAEVRALENLPFIDGSDTLMANGALQPMQVSLSPPAPLALPPGQPAPSAAADQMTPSEIARMLQQVYLAVGSVVSAEEARQLINDAGGNLTGPAPAPAKAVRSLLGRLGRVKSLSEVGVVEPPALQLLLDGWLSTDTPIEAVRAYLAALLRNETP